MKGPLSFLKDGVLTGWSKMIIPKKIEVIVTDKQFRRFLFAYGGREMKERPIIMGAESVRAILEGRKTQTRRVIDPIERAASLSLTPTLRERKL